MPAADNKGDLREQDWRYQLPIVLAAAEALPRQQEIATQLADAQRAQARGYFLPDEDERLREAFSFHTLLVGGSPMKTSAIYALIHKLEKDGGVWWARGGTRRR